jgi:hypothetical protein
MVFTVRGVILRLIAVIVLLSGVADYLAFDVGDPLAPMSAAGMPSLSRKSVDRHLCSATVLQTDTQDDGCICCGAGFIAHRVELLVAEIIATASALYILPPSDPQISLVDRPPRA